jgi:hypothetical protein
LYQRLGIASSGSRNFVSAIVTPSF